MKKVMFAAAIGVFSIGTALANTPTESAKKDFSYIQDGSGILNNLETSTPREKIIIEKVDIKASVGRRGYFSVNDYGLYITGNPYKENGVEVRIKLGGGESKFYALPVDENYAKFAGPGVLLAIKYDGVNFFVRGNIGSKKANYQVLYDEQEESMLLLGNGIRLELEYNRITGLANAYLVSKDELGILVSLLLSLARS